LHFEDFLSSHRHIADGVDINTFDLQVLMYALVMPQACKWQFLAFSGTFDVHLDVDENPDSRMLVFRLVESSFMKDFEGRWQV